MAPFKPNGAEDSLMTRNMIKIFHVIDCVQLGHVVSSGKCNFDMILNLATK